ncbi:hypothetical protein GBF38_020859, partial [Nibea albiflora]
MSAVIRSLIPDKVISTEKLEAKTEAEWSPDVLFLHPSRDIYGKAGPQDHPVEIVTSIVPSPAVMSPRKRPLVPVSSRRKTVDDYFPFNLLPVECQLHVFSFLNEVD